MARVVPMWALLGYSATGWEVIGLFESEREARAEAQMRVVRDITDAVVFKRQVVFSRSFETDEPQQG
jgi:hypothetical protein